MHCLVLLFADYWELFSNDWKRLAVHFFCEVGMGTMSMATMSVIA